MSVGRRADEVGLVLGARTRLCRDDEELERKSLTGRGRVREGKKGRRIESVRMLEVQQDECRGKERLDGRFDRQLGRRAIDQTTGQRVM